MSNFNVARCLALGLVLIALTGCKIDSVNPITPAADAQPDARLYGVWRYREKDELTYVHIDPEFSLRASGAAPDEHQRIRIVIVDHKPNGLTDAAYVAHASRVGPQRFLNVVQNDQGKPAGYILVRYRLTDVNTLRFATIDNEALKGAIRANQIAGTTRGEGLSSETAITAESSAVEAFLRKDGDRLFNRPFTLTRVDKR